MAKYPKGEPLKRGRRVLGTIVKAENGALAYLHHRNLKDIFRHGEASISDAIRKEKATWSIEEEILVRMRARGVAFAGILVRDSGDIYLTTLSRFFDRTIAKTFQAKNYIVYRQVPIGAFHCKRKLAVKL